MIMTFCAFQSVYEYIYLNTQVWSHGKLMFFSQWCKKYGNLNVGIYLNKSVEISADINSSVRLTNLLLIG